MEKRLRPQRIGPTPETVARRVWLVGDGDALDPRAEYPIGVLLLRGQLSSLQHDAAVRYSHLYSFVIGRGMPPSSLKDFIAGLHFRSEYDGETDYRVEAEWKAADAALLGLGTRRPRAVLVDLAVYEHPLRFMDDRRRRTRDAWRADGRDLAAVRAACDCLVHHWQMGRKAA